MLEVRSYNSPSDALTGLSAEVKDVTLLDFWKWAFCDLSDDDLKGVFAEWIVAKLLNHKMHRRISWADNDLLLDDGTRIEVKSSAFWQSWRSLDGEGKTRVQPVPIQERSNIKFARLKAREIASSQWKGDPQFKADIYVFAFQKERDYSKWNAMDLTQWEFYVAGKSKLRTSTVSLKSLEIAGFGPLSADQMVLRLTKEIELRKSQDVVQVSE